MRDHYPDILTNHNLQECVRCLWCQLFVFSFWVEVSVFFCLSINITIATIKSADKDLLSCRLGEKRQRDANSARLSAQVEVRVATLETLTREQHGTIAGLREDIEGQRGDLQGNIPNRALYSLC